MKEIFRKKSIRLAAVLIIVVAIVSVSAYFAAGQAGLFKNAAGSVSTPVNSAATAVIEWLEGIYGYLYKYDQLVAENESLRQQLSEAQDQARAASEALEENERLRQLLDLSEKHADFVFESAKVTTWSASNWTSSFTISKGESSGIELGDCVVNESLYLIGKVIELGSNWATVRTVVDVDMNIGVHVGDLGAAGMLSGDFALMQEGASMLKHLTDSTALLEGDVVLTSGEGNNFPPGLVVGTVVDVRTEAGGQSTYAVVEPSCNLDLLAQVFVIKEYNVAE